MKTGRAQQQLMAEQVSLLDRAITRVEDEIAYIKAASSLDITCQRLALYDVLDNYSYVARRCNFPSLPTLKNTSKAVQRERGVSSGEGPLLSLSEEDKTLENSRGKRKCQELEPEPAPKRLVPIDTSAFDIARSQSRIAIESKELHHMATARLDRWSRYKKSASEALKASSGFTSLPAGTMTAGAAALAKELNIELPSNTAA